ncbi:MAG TPA: hypothetical protein VGM31_14100, partial [Puia sp.]
MRHILFALALLCTCNAPAQTAGSVLSRQLAHASSQRLARHISPSGPNSIAPVGIIKGLSDSALLDVVQRQTFRYFWHYAHPVSGLARERDNTVKAEYYWDYINEAYDQPNF